MDADPSADEKEQYHFPEETVDETKEDKKDKPKEKIQETKEKIKEKLDEIPAEKKPVIYIASAVAAIVILFIGYTVITALTGPGTGVIGGIIMGGEEKDSTIYFFGTDNCPACVKIRQHLQQLQRENPQLQVQYLDSRIHLQQLIRQCRKHNSTCEITPSTFTCEKVFVGYMPGGDGDLEYMENYNAYKGYTNQISSAALECLG